MVETFVHPDLGQVTVLPLAQLQELVRTGVILSYMTFEDHMNPTVHWIEPEEFGRAFEELTQGEGIMPDDRFEAAHTDTDMSLPSYINARKGLIPGTVIITVRSTFAEGDEKLNGATAYHIMDLQDFDQWIADVQRLRQALG